MIRPIDIQVALNAIPQQGSLVFQKQAAEIYRNMQGLNEAHKQTLQQTNAIVKVTEANFALLQKLQINTPGKSRLNETQERYKQQHSKLKEKRRYKKGKNYYQINNLNNDLDDILIRSNQLFSIIV